LRIRAFQALRPPKEMAARVASEPYDAIETEDARSLAAANPHSFLHVIRAEVDLPQGTDIHAHAVYDQANAALRGLVERGALVQEDAPCLYVYRLQDGDHVQHGVVACCRTQDYRSGDIRKHEGTRPDKEDDRTRLAEALGAHPGPVFMAYRDAPAVDSLVSRAEEDDPIFDFPASDGVRHTGWRVRQTRELTAAFEEVSRFYIADGHHRSAAAARIAAARQADAEGEDAEFKWFLSVLFPAGQLRILPYNRLLSSLGRLGEEEFLTAVRQVCNVHYGTGAAPDQPREIGMYVGGRWYHLKLQASSRENPVSGLDVSLLQDRILRPLLGVGDPTRDPRLEFVSGARGTDMLQERVDSGAAAVAFTLFPVSLDEMMAVADAGLFMPPKSTWFAPKLCSGLFVHPF